MNDLLVDFNEVQGKVKPMHAVNNGPIFSVRGISNWEDFKAAGIPYARNHDASFFSGYGGNHTVDVDFIFPNFDADPNDPNSYDFACTDELMRVTALAGTETYYRLGSKIEHEVKKYNTHPPKDFKKWAVICEHIIRHYNYGWANGFRYDIKYWEIWNEPDLPGSPTWQGSREQFYELFNIALEHLKGCFPELKIGGPAICYWQQDWLEGFFKSLRTKPDFFSWHCYGDQVGKIIDLVPRYRALLDSYGLQNTESILNEWNYVKGWKKEEYIYTVRQIMGLKGAAYAGAVMAACQNLPLDMLMYYDARPCAFNGMWAPYTYDRLKGYYPFVAFNTLYQLGQNVWVDAQAKDIYLCAARNEKEAAVMIVHFNDDDNSGDVSFVLRMAGLSENTVAEYYVLDQDHDLELVERKKYVDGETVNLVHNGLLLIKLSDIV